MLPRFALILAILLGGFSAPLSAENPAPGATLQGQLDMSADLARQLEQRVRERWQARIDRDYDSLYAFSTPNFRKVFPRQLYVKGFSYGLDWELTGVEILNYDGRAAVASVAARVMSRPTKQTSQASFQAGAVPMTIIEQWLYVDDQWWYSANR